MSASNDIPPQERTQSANGAQENFKQGQLVLQQCTHCKTYLYPPRQVCCECLQDNLSWCPAPDDGVLIAKTTLHHSNVNYFRTRLPWHIGIVQLGIGPIIVVHIRDNNLQSGAAVKVITQLDEGGQTTFHALADG